MGSSRVGQVIGIGAAKVVRYLGERAHVSAFSFVPDADQTPSLSHVGQATGLYHNKILDRLLGSVVIKVSDRL